MAKFKAVFFDLDGTLWDNVACADHVMETVLLPKLSDYLPDSSLPEVTLRFNAALLELVTIHGLTGRRTFSRRTRFQRLLKSHGVQEEGLARELSTSYDGARRVGTGYFVRASAPGVLSRLRDKGLRVGIITNGAHAVQRHVIETLGLAPYVQHFVIGDLEGCSKPHPRLFERALELAGVKPRQMLYVGDSLITDVIGASRAGIPVAWLRRPDQVVPDNLPTPDYTIEDLSEVLPIVAA